MRVRVRVGDRVRVKVSARVRVKVSARAWVRIGYRVSDTRAHPVMHGDVIVSLC